jgi:hypothetical protein
MTPAIDEVRQAERKRHKEICNHPNVRSGAAIDLAVFIIVETDLSAAEAHAMLDCSIAQPPTNKVGNSH